MAFACREIDGAAKSVENTAVLVLPAQRAKALIQTFRTAPPQVTDAPDTEVDQSRARLGPMPGICCKSRKPPERMANHFSLVHHDERGCLDGVAPRLCERARHRLGLAGLIDGAAPHIVNTGRDVA